MNTILDLADFEASLGRQVRALRLRQGLGQRELASQAGLSVKAVTNIEGAKGATLRSLIQVLRALGRADWLNTLAPPVSISPVQMLKAKAPRQRAPRKSSRSRTP